MKLQPNETDLVGNWVSDGGRVIGDAVEQRINQLIESQLKRIAVDTESGWDVLFRDPQDGRYWELTYPNSGMHGGGPKRLTNLAAHEAIAKYSCDKTAFLDLS
jgi:hypothetical protein